MTHPQSTRAAALSRLADFTANMGHNYAHKRNFDYGPNADTEQDGWRDNVSRLSPYIRSKLLTEQELITAAVKAHGAQGADKFIAEVLWRGYFKGWLEQRPEVWADYVTNRDAKFKKLKAQGGLRKIYEQATEGRTGIDAFDHWAKELVETGYLHNHARMWFASIWMFTLKLPWELGADFFLQHLIDGDPASNTLSWRWVGGLHTKGKTYLATKENITQFTDGRFTPVGLAAETVPLEEDKNYKLRPLKIPPAPPAAAAFALLVHEDDCHPESLILPQKPSLIIGVSGSDGKSPKGVSDKVRAFSNGAVTDALVRAADHFSCDTVTWNKGEKLRDVLAKAKLERLLSPWLPVGALKDAIGKEISGNNVRWVMREYDAAIWPLATKGFFPVKKKAPDALRAMGMEL
ncbi:MAG: FAD-binding domain-containing protein [Parasphingorhabdus sp.]|uniref:FAD-binding domain-containing protein n=1 Tax=Parasphingorhabdus sp. TaxID=2709688 RepID=UPI003298EBAD